MNYILFIFLFLYPFSTSIMYRKIDTKRLNNKHIDNRAICRKSQ